MWEFLEKFVADHSGALLILLLFFILVVTLIILVPQLLRANLKKAEMQHQEHLKALEQGLSVPNEDERARFAARTAMLRSEERRVGKECRL